jgi:hypothetical protein
MKKTAPHQQPQPEQPQPLPQPLPGCLALPLPLPLQLPRNRASRQSIASSVDDSEESARVSLFIIFFKKKALI